MTHRSAVGSRELKTRLGSYLRHVRDGRTLLITDRGEPVAELRPVGQGKTTPAERLARLNASGSITRQQDRALDDFEPIPISRTNRASRLISEERKDRF
jgi:prevent-host-death family protein